MADEWIFTEEDVNKFKEQIDPHYFVRTVIDEWDRLSKKYVSMKVILVKDLIFNLKVIPYGLDKEDLDLYVKDE